MLKRFLFKQLLEGLKTSNVDIVVGPRRIGKTTLLKELEIEVKKSNSIIYVDFTDPAEVSLWSDFSSAKISRLVTQDVVFFDEIQYLPRVGLLLKLIHDHFPKVKIVATGSSSFLLLQSIGESLAGRKKIFELFPLSLSEIFNFKKVDYWRFNEELQQSSILAEKLKETLLFGGYPEVLSLKNKSEKIERLKEIADSFLFKDLLMFEGVKKPRLLVELTGLLAHQIGQLVNPNELGMSLNVSRKTVLDYIDLLEKFFVVKKVYPYEKNLRDVIRGKFKVYFFDLGIRNAVISDFREIENREDIGAILENAVFIGLSRRISYERKLMEQFFWRDYDGREVDHVIKKEDGFVGIEVKMKESQARFPKKFLRELNNPETFVADLKTAYRFCF